MKKEKVPQWRYNPKEDITPYELAWVVTLLNHPRLDRRDHPYWELIKRHFYLVGETKIV